MRSISSLNTSQVTSADLAPVFFIELTLLSGTIYACTAPFAISWGGNIWAGVGDVGKVSTIAENTEVVASGCTISLSGIDNALLEDSLNDIGALLPCAIYLGFFQTGATLIDTPLQIYGGVVDTPTITQGPEHSEITIALENRLLNLQRGAQRRYTAEDQHRLYPDDTAFGWIPQLNDLALRWG